MVISYFRRSEAGTSRSAGEDDFAAHVSALDLAVGVGRLAQRVCLLRDSELAVGVQVGEVGEPGLGAVGAQAAHAEFVGGRVEGDGSDAGLIADKLKGVGQRLGAPGVSRAAVTPSGATARTRSARPSP